MPHIPKRSEEEIQTLNTKKEQSVNLANKVINKFDTFFQNPKVWTGAKVVTSNANTAQANNIGNRNQPNNNRNNNTSNPPPNQNPQQNRSDLPKKNNADKSNVCPSGYSYFTNPLNVDLCIKTRQQTGCSDSTDDSETEVYTIHVTNDGNGSLSLSKSLYGTRRANDDHPLAGIMCWPKSYLASFKKREQDDRNHKPQVTNFRCAGQPDGVCKVKVGQRYTLQVRVTDEDKDVAFLFFSGLGTGKHRARGAIRTNVSMNESYKIFEYDLIAWCDADKCSNSHWTLLTDVLDSKDNRSNNMTLQLDIEGNGDSKDPLSY